MTFLLQLLDELVGNGSDMAIGAPGGDDHAIGHGRLAGEVDRHDVLGLGILELGADDLEKRVFRLAASRNTGFGRACRRGSLA